MANTLRVICQTNSSDNPTLDIVDELAISRSQFIYSILSTKVMDMLFIPVGIDAVRLQKTQPFHECISAFFTKESPMRELYKASLTYLGFVKDKC